MAGSSEVWRDLITKPCKTRSRDYILWTRMRKGRLSLQSDMEVTASDKVIAEDMECSTGWGDRADPLGNRNAKGMFGDKQGRIREDQGG